MKKLIIILSLTSLILSQPISAANASPQNPWKLTITKPLSEMNQFESPELNFKINIEDEKVINFLKQKGAGVSTYAVLTENKQESYSFEDSSPYNRKKSRLSYACGNSTKIGVSNFGKPISTALVATDKGFEMNFKCYFPVGMKPSSYVLTIKSDLNMNGGGSSLDSWANQQLFNIYYEDNSITPNFSEGFPNTTIQQIKSPKAILVSSNFTDESRKILNVTPTEFSKIGQDLRNKAIGLIKDSTSVSKTFNNIPLRIQNLKVKIIGLKKTQKKKMATFEKLEEDLKLAEDKYYELLSQVQDINSGIFTEDLRAKYLAALNYKYDISPELISIDFPSSSSISTNLTPFIRLNFRSIAPISSAKIGIRENNDGNSKNLGFGGNVVIPGETTSGIEHGYALIEKQSIEKDYILSTILLAPSRPGARLNQADVDSYPSFKLACGAFDDMEGNPSPYWNEIEVNGRAGGCKEIPSNLSRTTNGKDFDALRNQYNLLAASNYSVQSRKYFSTEISNSIKSLSTQLVRFEKIAK